MGQHNIERMLESAGDMMGLCRALVDASPLGEKRGVRMRKMIIDCLLQIIMRRGDQHDHFHPSSKTIVEFVSVQIGSMPEESDVADVALKVVSLLSGSSDSGDLDDHSSVLDAEQTEATDLPVLDLLSHCLNIVSTSDSVEYRLPQGHQQQRPMQEKRVTGQQFKKMIIEKLCAIEWPSRYVNSYAIMIKEISIDEAELKLVCDKLFQCVDLLKWSDLATFIHHVLVISHKGLKSYFLKKVLEKYGGLFSQL